MLGICMQWHNKADLARLKQYTKAVDSFCHVCPSCHFGGFVECPQCAQRRYRLHSWLWTGQPLMKLLHIHWHSNESLATRAFSTVTCNSHSVLCLLQWPDVSFLYFWLWAWRYSNYRLSFSILYISVVLFLSYWISNQIARLLFRCDL